MTFSKSKSKKKNKDNFGMLTFIDIGTPIRKNDSSNVLCWQWLQDVTQTSGSKYFETFVQLVRSNVPRVELYDEYEILNIYFLPNFPH